MMNQIRVNLILMSLLLINKNDIICINSYRKKKKKLKCLLIFNKSFTILVFFFMN